MPLIYKPYQATLANKEGQKLYYPRLVKFGKMVNTQKMEVSSSQITSLRCQFTPEYTRAANGSATRALTTGVEFVHIKDVAGSFVADDVVDKDPDDGDEPGGGGGEAPDPAA